MEGREKEEVWEDERKRGKERGKESGREIKGIADGRHQGLLSV